MEKLMVKQDNFLKMGIYILEISEIINVLEMVY